MTVRLVALMSVVLLLSLGAFGLVMNHYQDQVVEEVTRTVSDVSKATLRTFEFREDRGPAAFRFHPPAGALPESRCNPGDTESHEGDAAVCPEVGTAGGYQVFFRTGAPPQERIGGDPPARHEVRRWISRGEGPTTEVACTINGEIAECNRFTHVSGLHEGDGTQPVQVIGNVLVDADAVHAERFGQDSVLLRIPTLTPRASEPAAGDGDAEASMVTARWNSAPAAAGGDFFFADKNEIQLPIEMNDFGELNRSLRSRSMLLFLGVFLVGTALSAGVAARFTRPIRRLDAGIRRLSAGDLDVAVEVQGQDEIARLGLAFNDMTHQLRESRDRNREMVRREKLSALGGLAAGVAHDVRNPLHSIGLTLQHLRETCRPEAEERAAEFDRSTEIIRGEIRRLDQLVSNFLSFSRSEPRERGPVDLANLIEETARLVRKEAEWRGIDIDVDAMSNLPDVNADAESLRAALLNLVLNSFEAMPGGGRLSLTLRIDGPLLVVEVTDNGRGIPPADLDRVFEFAYTTREAGNGVGLAMVHHCIVEEHGGTVGIRSKPDQGTTVRVALPIRPALPEESE